MPSRSSSDLRHETKQQPKLYSRLLIKDSSAANPSFRVYYGGATGAVPFVWESQPGTPKSSIAATTLPPLTPPPSYHVSPSHNKGFSTSTTKKSPKFTLIHTFLPRLITLIRKTNSPLPVAAVFSLPSPSVSSSSSSFSPAGSAGSRHRSRFSSSRSSFSDEDSESPTSTMCFGVRRRDAGRGQGCYSVVIMKNALLSIVGHGSSQDAAKQSS